MHSYWIVSAPSEGGQMFGRLDAATSSMSSNSVLRLPKLRAGTLDSLMTLSDDLQRMDNQVEGVVRKIERQMADLSITELTVNVDRHSMTPDEFVADFRWASNKYQEKLTLPEITGKIHGEVMKIDEELRGKQQDYNQIRTQLQTILRKQSGNLAVRSLTSLELDRSGWLDTENFTTVLVVVPKADEKTWRQTYETGFLDREPNLGFYPVLLGSTRRVYEDEDSSLWTVSIFRRKLQDFKLAVREKQPRWTVREYAQDDTETAKEKENIEQLTQHEAKAKKALITWTKAMYGETFRAFVHVKAIRAFVESCLRYGVPPDFTTAVMRPNMKYERKLRNVLADLFQPRSDTISQMFQGDISDVLPVGLGTQDFYPYVYVPLNVAAAPGAK